MTNRPQFAQLCLIQCLIQTNQNFFKKTETVVNAGSGERIRTLVGQGPELKGDVHPIQCPVNALGEVNEEYTYGKASRTADVTDGEIKKTIYATFRWA